MHLNFSEEVLIRNCRLWRGRKKNEGRNPQQGSHANKEQMPEGKKRLGTEAGDKPVLPVGGINAVSRGDES